MTEISSERIETVTIPSALRDIGWIPLLFSTIVGAPSILALLQMALQFDLTSSLRWIVQGYNALTEMMGRVFEPLILPVVRLVGTLLKIDLSLYPHWRPLFLMGMVVATSITRSALPTNDRLASFLLWMLMAMGALIGAVVAGLAPPDSGAPAQLLFAASPFFGIVVAVASLQLIIIMVGMLDGAEGQESPTATPLSAILYVSALLFAVAIALALSLGLVWVLSIIFLLPIVGILHILIPGAGAAVTFQMGVLCSISIALILTLPPQGYPI
jgi:hypothetical protein